MVPCHYIGVSIPRSGHSHLRRILSRYFGRELKFCDAYRPEHCCGRFPCTELGGATVFYQKNHDLLSELARQRGVEGLVYVVQYRHPVPQILSRLEFAGVPPGSPGRVAWLANKARERIRFTRKWLADEDPAVFRLSYEDLTADPVRHVGALLVRGVGVADLPRLRETVAAVSGIGSLRQSYRRRVIEESPHFDARLLAGYEALVLREAPDLGYRPMFPAGAADADNPVLRAFALREAPAASER